MDGNGEFAGYTRGKGGGGKVKNDRLACMAIIAG